MAGARTDPRLYMGLAALGILAGGGVLYMQYSGLAEQQAKVAILANEVRAQKDLPQQLEASKQELARIRTELAHLEQDVPDFAYVPTMLRQMEALGTSSGLRVVGCRPLAKSDAAKAAEANGARKPYEELDIEIRAQGNFVSVLRLIEALDRFPKIVQARAVSVEPKPDALKPREKPPLEVLVRLRAYLFKARPKDSLLPSTDLDAPAKSAPAGNQTVMSEGIHAG